MVPDGVYSTGKMLAGARELCFQNGVDFRGKLRVAFRKSCFLKNFGW